MFSTLVTSQLILPHVASNLFSYGLSLLVLILDYLLREAITRKNLLLFGKSSNGLDPPHVFLESFEELFLHLILDKLKFLKLFGFELSSPILLRKHKKRE